jgi:hypothetical protein
MYYYKWVREIDFDIANSLSSLSISGILRQTTFTTISIFYKKLYDKIKSNE